jgi:hypothetical protein
LTEQQVGAGRAYYLGWYPTEPQAQALLARLASQAGINSLAALPDGLVAFQRGGHLILLNFTDVPLTATVEERFVRVGPRDVEVIKTQG